MSVMIRITLDPGHTQNYIVKKISQNAPGWWLYFNLPQPSLNVRCIFMNDEKVIKKR